LQSEGCIVVNLALYKGPAYGINRDELGMPPDFLKLLLQINCSYSD